jgi:primase-polymerase (primpol)-like protein
MKQKLRSVLIAEIVRFVTAQETAHRVLYHEDIDLTKMNNLAKVEEEQHKTDTYLMQSNKSTRKSDGNFHYTPTSTTRNYYDEEIIDRDGPFIIYQLGNPVCESIFKTLLTGFQLVSIL